LAHWRLFKAPVAHAPRWFPERIHNALRLFIWEALRVKSIAPSFRLDASSLVVLAPASAQASKIFRQVEVDSCLRGVLLADMQRFRGGVYLNDGAILPDALTKDGRHIQSIDDDSWHVLTLRPDGTVCACLRFLEQNARHFDRLWVRQAALMRSDTWAPKLKEAVESEMTYSRAARISFGEVGGWAIAPDRRLTMEPLRTILATYGLLELLGGCSGIATATRRHGSAPMLRKIGLSPLVIDGTELPAYYDPRYRCEMEVLRFDSRFPNPRFRNWVNELRSFLTTAPVICNRGLPHDPVPGPRRLPIAALPAPALAGSY
jgi:hypothetical protein